MLLWIGYQNQPKKTHIILLFKKKHTHHDWLTKEYISNWITASKGMVFRWRDVNALWQVIILRMTIGRAKMVRNFSFRSQSFIQHLNVSAITKLLASTSFSVEISLKKIPVWSKSKVKACFVRMTKSSAYRCSDYHPVCTRFGVEVSFIHSLAWHVTTKETTIADLKVVSKEWRHMKTLHWVYHYIHYWQWLVDWGRTRR